jgi:hypothetical protein
MSYEEEDTRNTQTRPSNLSWTLMIAQRRKICCICDSVTWENKRTLC